jgi:late competence protein required for DNA uptake (superfamily II DNA/RNA helicase)
MRFNNPNHCLYCGQKLSCLHLLRNSLYCRNSHQLAHVRAQNELLSWLFRSDRGSAGMIRWEPCDPALKTEDLS